MNTIIEFIPELCVGCGACAVACMDQNDINPMKGESPLRTVVSTETESEGKCVLTSFSMACLHCEDAPCIEGCPTGCLKKDPATGMTIFDDSVCIGCHSCAMACPYGVPAFNKDGKIIKCNGCYVRVGNGMLPACVRTCPTGALKFRNIETISKEKKEKTIKELLQQIEDNKK